MLDQEKLRTHGTNAGEKCLYYENELSYRFDQDQVTHILLAFDISV